ATWDELSAFTEAHAPPRTQACQAARLLSIVELHCLLACALPGLPLAVLRSVALAAAERFAAEATAAGDDDAVDDGHEGEDSAGDSQPLRLEVALPVLHRDAVKVVESVASAFEPSSWQLLARDAGVAGPRAWMLQLQRAAVTDAPTATSPATGAMAQLPGDGWTVSVGMLA
ncbi:hypothetical protein HK405_013633, partial [Cladochytrium tenue]